MAHRKKNAPRRGSLAYRPRGRTTTVVPVVRNWSKVSSEKPIILGSAGFKVGSTHVMSVDNRAKTPNFGKPLFSSATIIATPPILILGFRAYKSIKGGRHGSIAEAMGDIYMENPPKEYSRKVNSMPKFNENSMRKIEESLGEIDRFTILSYISPRTANLSQKKPYVFEIGMSGGEIKEQLEKLKSILGKEVKISEIFEQSPYVDILSISKGKGFQGVIKRMGVKRKSHKSNKTVREVASIGPWNPHNVVYTVPRAGQKGVKQTTEYNKRILSMADTKDIDITPKGGFGRYGEVKGDYMILKGSVPGPSRGLVRFRMPIRPPKVSVQPVKILEIATVR